MRKKKKPFFLYLKRKATIEEKIKEIEKVLTQLKERKGVIPSSIQEKLLRAKLKIEKADEYLRDILLELSIYKKEDD